MKLFQTVALFITSLTLTACGGSQSSLNSPDMARLNFNPPRPESAPHYFNCNVEQAKQDAEQAFVNQAPVYVQIPNEATLEIEVNAWPELGTGPAYDPQAPEIKVTTTYKNEGISLIQGAYGYRCNQVTGQYLQEQSSISRP